MSSRGLLRGGLAVALLASAIAGCGGGSKTATPSALDPASMAPASSIIYISASIRPQGTLAQNLGKVIDDVAGPSAASELVSKVTSGSGSAQQTWKQVKPWLGQQVGAALIGLPPRQPTAQALLNYALLILPTSDPSAAKSYLSSKLGNSTAVTYKIVGDYALVGGPFAVQMASGVTARTALAGSLAYRKLLSQVGQGAFASFYLRAYPFLTFERRLLSEKAVPPADLTILKQSMAKIRKQSSVLMTLNVTSDTARLEYAAFDAPQSDASSQGSPPSVASLPAGSWLAIALRGGLGNSTTLKTLESSFQRLSVEEARSLGSASKGLQFVTSDVLPALGPMSLSVSGQTKASVKLGFAMTPTSQTAGDRLLAVLQQMLRGSAVKQLELGRDGDKLVATYGYKSFGEMLAPSRALSSNPTFSRAAAQLPRGSVPAVFVNFAPIEAIVKLSHGSDNARVAKVLSHLDYLIAGGHQGSFQLVLGVK